MSDHGNMSINGRLSQCKACEEWCESEFCSDECREYWEGRDQRL